MNVRQRLPQFAVALALLVPAKAQLATSAYTNFEAGQVTPIRLSADGSRLFAANTAASRLSVFDTSTASAPKLIAEIPVGIEPVSVNPRSNDEVWVVNQESDSVSVVSVSRGVVTDTINVGDEPSDVVFAGRNYAFVSVSRNNQVCVYNTASHQRLKCIPIFGNYPRNLAVSPDGRNVYALVGFSGNQTTVIPAGIAPAPPAPTNPSLPPAPGTGIIVDIGNTFYDFYLRFQMPDNDVAVIDVSLLAVTRYYDNVGALNLGIAVRPTTGDLFVTNTQARNLIRFEPALRGHFIDSRLTSIQQTSGLSAAYDLNPNIDYNVLPNPGALATALSQPTAAVFEASGQSLWIAAFGTDRVAKVDINGNVSARVEIGPATGASVNPRTKRGPRGLALHPSSPHLYVLNRLSNTLSVVDTNRRSVTSEIPVGSFDPTPLEIREGRGFLYDAKLSGNGTGSCAGCHVDADMDHLSWDLGDPGGEMATVESNGQSFTLHPMKGPMTTQTLRGLADLAPYHWRGDRADFAAFNPAFDSLMGGSPISSNDMAAYTAFINTIRMQPNPNQNLDRTYPTSLKGGNAQNGFLLYNTINSGMGTCNSCHTIGPGPGSNRTLVQLNRDPQPLKVPQLRNVYQKLTMDTDARQPSMSGFGITHAGNVGTLQDFITGAFPLIGRNPVVVADLSALILSVDTGMAPAVGYTRTITAANLAQAQTDWGLLQQQAAVGNIDLIVKGTIDGEVHGLLYNAATATYRADAKALGPFTNARLTQFIRDGDTLTVMGVPPGSGTWMGIDFNANGVLDADEPR